MRAKISPSPIFNDLGTSPSSRRQSSQKDRRPAGKDGNTALLRLTVRRIAQQLNGDLALAWVLGTLIQR